jgi:hypothetical protein
LTGESLTLKGGATIVPPAGNEASVGIFGFYSANSGDAFSIAYSFTVDSDVSLPVTYSLSGSATVGGQPVDYEAPELSCRGFINTRGR